MIFNTANIVKKYVPSQTGQTINAHFDIHDHIMINPLPLFTACRHTYRHTKIHIHCCRSSVLIPASGLFAFFNAQSGAAKILFV